MKKLKNKVKGRKSSGGAIYIQRSRKSSLVRRCHLGRVERNKKERHTAIRRKSGPERSKNKHKALGQVCVGVS